MNAPIRKIAAIMSALVASGGLTACVGSFDPATDARSPVAPRVQAMVDANREYPRWAEFPRAVEPLPEPMAIAAQVNTLRITSGALAGEVSRIDWQTTQDPAAFAAEVQARIDAVPVAPVTAETLAEIEDFVRRTRERGRAPPPVDRR
ncbi:MAG: hypothetical protein KKE42_03935 [Alphaproteobacteria bacterium]|nr:hypothetical protein [Brevundimonas sp.]MBU3969379.1 hypothetical protein [Alphaproteobacteria bacterium]MBU3972934.1 hypothetical protein [Alphaproteobacteria bacterium]MBU4038967.1 hypothetical protein [Alphaproteobacteria bacterium]MBU4137330.1 hypothetical protein [Alphaproteobacteria bacterium]